MEISSLIMDFRLRGTGGQLWSLKTSIVMHQVLSAAGEDDLLLGWNQSNSRLYVGFFSIIVPAQDHNISSSWHAQLFLSLLAKGAPKVTLSSFRMRSHPELQSVLLRLRRSRCIFSYFPCCLHQNKRLSINNTFIYNHFQIRYRCTSFRRSALSARPSQMNCRNDKSFPIHQTSVLLTPSSNLCAE